MDIKNYVFAEIKPSFAEIPINAFNERPLSFHNRIYPDHKCVDNNANLEQRAIQK